MAHIFTSCALAHSVLVPAGGVLCALGVIRPILSSCSTADTGRLFDESGTSRSKSLKSPRMTTSLPLAMRSTAMALSTAACASRRAQRSPRSCGRASKCAPMSATLMPFASSSCAT
eukprot:7055-Heterococcus_DN1.PRE.5